MQGARGLSDRANLASDARMVRMVPFPLCRARSRPTARCVAWVRRAQVIGSLARADIVGLVAVDAAGPLARHPRSDLRSGWVPLVDS